MEFYAFHGFYREEQKLGNKYLVNITLHVDLQDAWAKDDLNRTIDYVKVYKIVRSCMELRSKLLEHVAARIAKALFEAFTDVQRLEIRVAKKNPPIGGICDRAEVELVFEPT
jgi:dihydroneopterin aldolase